MTASLSMAQVEALLSLYESLSNSIDPVRELELGIETFCCRYWAGDRDSPTNPLRKKINIRTYTHLQADAICVLRRTRDFGIVSGGATVSEGRCSDDDWLPS